MPDTPWRRSCLTLKRSSAQRGCTPSPFLQSSHMSFYYMCLSLSFFSKPINMLAGSPSKHIISRSKISQKKCLECLPKQQDTFTSAFQTNCVLLDPVPSVYMRVCIQSICINLSSVIIPIRWLKTVGHRTTRLFKSSSTAVSTELNNEPLWLQAFTRSLCPHFLQHFLLLWSHTFRSRETDRL